MHIEDIYSEVDGLTRILKEAGKIIAGASIDQGFSKAVQKEAVEALQGILQRAEEWQEYLDIQRQIVDEEEDRELARIQRAAIERVNKGIEELTNNKMDNNNERKTMKYTDDHKLSVELAAALVEDRFDNAYEIKSDGSEGFTEEAQDLFNELHDTILNNLTEG